MRTSTVPPPQMVAVRLLEKEMKSAYAVITSACPSRSSVTSALTLTWVVSVISASIVTVSPPVQAFNAA